MSENSLNRLKSPADYLSAAEHRVFPSLGALKWFMRCHRAELVDAGALVSVNRRKLIDPDPFEGKVLEIGRKVVAEAA